MTFNRYTAAGLHLTISALVALIVLLAMRLVWYPSPYFEAIDAGGLILILVSVDVVLGPLITLIVFNRKKPELRRDLTIVALLQLAALAYGMHVVFIARPVYAVFNVDRFDIVSAAQIDPDELRKATNPEFNDLPWLGPKVIGSKLPTDNKESTKILFAAVSGGADVYHLPKYYVPYSEVMTAALQKAHPLADLRKKKENEAAIDKFVAEHGLPESRMGFVPLRGRTQDFSVVLDRDTGKVVGFLFINPYS